MYLRIGNCVNCVDKMHKLMICNWGLTVLYGDPFLELQYISGCLVVKSLANEISNVYCVTHQSKGTTCNALWKLL